MQTNGQQTLSITVATALAIGCGRRLPDAHGTVGVWLRRVKTRRQLGDLSARDLADIGRSERERQIECGKWFWQR